ncbi:hypothetical protein [Kingella potus]|uniref:hypothetical protein n=1 Tax=Kingella potus TaxID=265175 RepID=UPI0011C03447|nr:hypothetical protein [Kingella potus]UOP01138.1 hypothetical protein LVJ84_02090 [Kingella potus]
MRRQGDTPYAGLCWMRQDKQKRPSETRKTRRKTRSLSCARAGRAGEGVAVCKTAFPPASAAEAATAPTPTLPRRRGRE